MVSSLAAVLVDIPAVSQLHAHSKPEISVALYCVKKKIHILEWPLIVPSTKCTCVMEKEQMLANRDVSKYVPKMLKKLAFFCI
jgi:hypothetical protein